MLPLECNFNFQYQIYLDWKKQFLFDFRSDIICKDIFFGFGIVCRILIKDEGFLGIPIMKCR